MPQDREALFRLAEAWIKVAQEAEREALSTREGPRAKPGQLFSLRIGISPLAVGQQARRGCATVTLPADLDPRA